MTIDKRSALEGVFGKIASESRASQKAYRRFCILQMATNYTSNERIEDLKAMLRRDRLNRDLNPFYHKPPLYRWGLIASWIAERRRVLKPFVSDRREAAE